MNTSLKRGPATDALARARQHSAHLASLPVMDGRLLKVMGEPETGSPYQQPGGLVQADLAPAVADHCAHFHTHRLPESEPVAASDLPVHVFQLTEDSLAQFACEMASEARLTSTLARKGRS